MSFQLTKEKFTAKQKTVTRRVGWWNLKAGDILWGCGKCMGLKKGEKVERIHQIRIVSVRQERLRALTDRYGYGLKEIHAEGFLDHPTLNFPHPWVAWFCATHGCTPEEVVNRIEFEYL